MGMGLACSNINMPPHKPHIGQHVPVCSLGNTCPSPRLVKATRYVYRTHPTHLFQPALLACAQTHSSALPGSPQVSRPLDLPICQENTPLIPYLFLVLQA